MKKPDARTFERKTRDYALHLALWVRQDGNRLVLRKRYGDRKVIGTFQTWRAVERAIGHFGEHMLAEREHMRR